MASRVRPALGRALTRARVRQTGRGVLTIMVVPHSTATPWALRVPTRLLQVAAVSVAAVSLVAVAGVAAARWEGGHLRAARVDLGQLRGVRAAAAAQATTVNDQAEVLAGEAKQMATLQQTVSALLRAPAAQAPGSAGVPAIAGTDKRLTEARTSLQAIAAALPTMQATVTELSREMAAWSSTAAHTPSIWPVIGPITSPYGWRPMPFDQPGTQFHDGVDIGVPVGTPVHATAAGRVIVAGYNSIYGNEVRLDDGNGLQTLYGHNSRLLVRVGETVAKGQVISLSGDTGYSTGPHVHYEIDINGRSVNPASYLPGY